MQSGTQIPMPRGGTARDENGLDFLSHEGTKARRRNGVPAFSCLRAFVPSCEIFDSSPLDGEFSDQELRKGKKWGGGCCLLLACLCAGTLTAWAGPDPAKMPTDDEVKAQASALQVAGAFSNDGFKNRDGHAFFKIAPKEPKFIQVNLYSGNQYWFIAAASGPAKKIAVTIFDEKGKFVATEPYENTAQAAAGFSPQVSGPYIVRIQELEGEPATACLLYSYK